MEIILTNNIVFHPSSAKNCVLLIFVVVCDEQVCPLHHIVLFVCAERHPIEYAIDGTNRWWQSPSIKNGMEYHYVTITLDLKQVCMCTLSFRRLARTSNKVHYPA